jgi:formate hydrogenlyase transcriptional activator
MNERNGDGGMTQIGCNSASIRREQDSMIPENNLHTELKARLRFETLIADLSLEFVKVPASDVDGQIMDAERRICEFLGLDLAALWQWSVDTPSVLTPTHVYAHDGLQAPGQMRQEHFPWFLREMLAGRMVAISSLAELPAEAAVDREVCRQLGVKSNLTIPLSVGGEPPIGVLGFNALRTERDWPEALVKRLQLVAQIFANALARKRADQALRESEERLNLAADSAEAGLWVLDCRTRVFWATKEARVLFGYSPDQVVSMDCFKESVLPDDWDLVRSSLERSLNSDEPLNVEYRIRLGDGRTRWIASRGRPRSEPSGEPGSLMGVSVDITDRKRAEEMFRSGQARLKAGADLAGIGCYEVDFVEPSCFADDRFHKICGVPAGYHPNLKILQLWMQHLHPEDQQRVLDERQKLHDGRLERISIEYRYLHPTLGQRWIHHVARVSARDAAGRTTRSYGAVRDITLQRQEHEALLQSYAEIEQLKERLQAEADYLKSEIKVTQDHGEVVGRSARIRKVLRQAEQVAPTDSSVLIYGETGTGKELIAQTIHRLSSRGSRVMVKVNCAALPSALVESELFGREKGAFTGALMRQVGRFELADGSTIFLDELGELPLEVQSKLLRVLQEGQLERLGSPKTIKVNVRVIGATNRDLAEEVRKGGFRADLYYRLNVFPIHVPPLRDRPEDIPLMVWAFIEEFSTRMGKKITQVPRKTMELLQRHSWPGNVRELRNVIEHSAIITTDETLRVPMLEQANPEAMPFRTLADSEREHIMKALEKTGWRIKGPDGAATLLGLNPSTLYGRMRKLGIQSRSRNGEGGG